MSRYTFGSLLLMAIIATTACKQTKPQPNPKAVVDVDGHLPLQQAIAPVHYTLDIQVDPVGGVNRGSMVMVIDVKKPTNKLLFHAQDLKIHHISASPMQKRVVFIDGQVQPGKNGAMQATFDRALTTGKHTIRMSWDGRLPTAPSGLYRLKDGNQWYAFTQFEPLEARRAFPCIDEPGYKTTFDVTLNVPKGHLAFANTPQKDLKSRPSLPTMDSYIFKRSKPMPTYLVAFAVGPFDVVNAKTTDKSMPPLRVIVPRGKAALAQYALQKTPAILKDLEAYFGQPYPYAKLDVVAVPNFAAGAMENIGLVTFREQLLLLDEQRATENQKYAMRSVMAHELAHMWFGNYVTPAWWNDLWLNESFATWMASEVMKRTAPEYDPQLRQVRGMARLMGRDSLPKTRSIRQPIKHGGDIYNAFDGMTYSKGAALLRMIESWIGPKVFQRAIQAYMKRHAHGNATSNDLMRAFKEASKKEVSQTISLFLDQPGVPLFTIDAKCEQNKHTISLQQTRYTPKGLKLPETKPWRVPMCFAMISNGKRSKHCQVVEPSTSTITLPGDQCYDTVYPNNNADGYYLWQFKSAKAWRTLAAAKSLNMREKLSLFEQLSALSSSDASLIPAYYELAMAWLSERDWRLFDRGAGVITGMKRTARKNNLWSSYQHIVQTHYQPKLKTLGLDPKASEPIANRRARRAIIGALSWIEDPYIVANAQSVMTHFLKQPDQVPAHRARWALSLAAQRGDATLFDALLQIVKTTKNPRTRQHAIRALGSFRDPALLKRAWQLLLDGTLRGTEMWAVLGPSFSHEPSYALMWGWLTSSYDPLLKKLGPLAGRSMPWMASGFCTAQDKKKVIDFFQPKLNGKSGITRVYTNVLASIDRCITWRADAKPTIVKILKANTPPAPATPETQPVTSPTSP